MKQVQRYLAAVPMPLTIAITFVLALGLGWLSWIVEEKPAL